jgi:dCTP deaminase
MAFWKGETLLARLPSLIGGFDPDQIDCASYTLRLGKEVFVTPDLPNVGGTNEGVTTRLSTAQQIRITPGQFAFLLTRESVEVPTNAIAFISMKTTYKFRGLINVSGFHVDPGWKGHLIFSVYNAGPNAVCLSEGMPLFLIWYADLDGTSEKVKKPGTKIVAAISPDLVSNMSGEIFSPILLNRRINNLNEKLSEVQQESLKLRNWLYVAATILITGVAGLGTVLWDMHKEQTAIGKEIAVVRATTPTTSALPQTPAINKPTIKNTQDKK